MKDSFKEVFSDKIIKYSISAAEFLIVIQTLFILFILPKLPPLIPLLNSNPWGVDRLYPSWAILFIPLILVLVFILNNILSTIFYRTNTLISRILSFNCLLFTMLSLVAFGQIIFLVF